MPRRTKPIRVGMIRCDDRALWYGAIFDKIDPAAYAKMAPTLFHHMTWYAHRRIVIRFARGFRLVKLYDRDRKKAQRWSDAFRTKPEVCKTLDEVSDDVDLVFIANDAGDGRDHLRLATPGLKKGVPTFIDRPFARTVKDAKAMIALARRKKTPLLSCSHMRLLPDVLRFKARFPELGALDGGFVMGHGPNPAHVADGIEMGIVLFGDDFRGRVKTVQSMGTWPLEVTHLHFAKPRSKRVLQAVVLNSHAGEARRSFFAKAISLRMQIDSGDMELSWQPDGGKAVMDALKKMIKTRRPALPYKDMLEVVAVMEAGRRAHNKARPVALTRLRA